MRVATAMLPDASSSQDRIFVADSAVIVLDGASAFVPVEVSPSTYVDTLGQLLVDGLNAGPRNPLTDVLAQAIKETVSRLDLSPGSSPSSTVAIARQHGGVVDLLVLGDTQIATPRGIMRDDRLSALATSERRRYQDRLGTGLGYDDEHRALLRALQEEQARFRNREGGYWIAEASARAASRAMASTFAVHEIPWCVLATDGVYRPVEHLGIDDWLRIAGLDHVAMGLLLEELDRWEAEEDPDGRALPRAKRHDDKAIVAVRVSGELREPDEVD
jgi:hypothetical protein